MAARKGTYPGMIVLHERWGLTAQIKSIAMGLACEGYMVLIPNLYGRQGGMVTASAEVADALVARIKEADTLQDINSCCEFLNTRDHIKKIFTGWSALAWADRWPFALRAKENDCVPQ